MKQSGDPALVAMEQNSEQVMTDIMEQNTENSEQAMVAMEQNSEQVVTDIMEQNSKSAMSDLAQDSDQAMLEKAEARNDEPVLMELSEPCQKAVLKLLSKFCLEKLTFNLHVNVSASLAFQLDDGDTYQMIAEDIVTRDDVVERYRETCVDQEVQTDSVESDWRLDPAQYLPAMSSEAFDPVAVKVEVNTDIEDQIAAAGGLETVMTMLRNAQKLQQPKRGRGRPKKAAPASCPLCPLTFEDKETVEAHLRTLHDVGNSYTCSVCDTKFLSTVELMNHISTEHDYTKQAKAAAENKKRSRPRKGAPKKLTTVAVNSDTTSPRSKRKRTSKYVEDSGTEDYEDDLIDDIIEETNEDSTIDDSKSSGSKLLVKFPNEQSSNKPKKKKPAPAKCDECGKDYSSRRALRRHVKAIHDKTEYQCEICGKSFHGKESLFHHKRGIHQGVKAYKCSEPGCDAMFNFSHSLRLHKLKHSGSRPHQCSMCGKTYLTGHHLKVHMQATHSVKQYACTVCGKMFSYSYSLKTHEATHARRSRVNCDQCDKSFVNAQALKYHVSSRHSEQGNFPCVECKKFYKTEFLLKIHMKRHSLDNTRFMCDLCGKRFMYKSALEMHKAIHRDDKGYRCNICDKTFKTYATLYSHRTVHKEDCPFKCCECGKGFKTREQCKSHERRHSGIKPFECKICHHRFPDNGGLSKHVRTVHCTVKRFVCSICGKATSRADNLRVHMKVHNKGAAFQAEIITMAENYDKSDTSMPTVVPHSFEGDFLKKSKSSSNTSTSNSSTITGNKGKNDQSHSGNMMVYNQSIPNLPTLEPVHRSGKSEAQSLPLDLQNPSHSISAPYHHAKPSTVGHARGDDMSEEGDVLQIDLPDSSPTGDSPGAMPPPPLHASPLVYAPWPGYVYTSGGIQPQQTGANGYYQ